MKQKLLSAGCPLRRPTPAEEAAIVRYYEVNEASTQQTAQELLATNHLAVYDDCGFYQEGRWGTVIVSFNGWDVELFAYDHTTPEVTLIQHYRRRNAIVVYFQKQVSRFIKYVANTISAVVSSHSVSAVFPNSQL